MGRNTGGVYSLPGTSFVSGTVISSTTMNSKLADIEAALTDSLSRSGDGDMIAELRVPDGSAALPTLSWTNDPGTGFYLAATSSFRAVILAATVQEWTSTGVSIQKPLTVTQAATLNSTLAVTGTTTFTGTLVSNGGATASTTVTNGTAITATGNGTGAGISGTGGTGGFGVLGTGGAGAAGVRAVGGSGAPGISAQGTGSHGVVGTGDNGNYGAVLTGGATAGGALIRHGTAATASTPQSAVVLDNGYIAFSGVANPNSDVAFVDSITPTNINKVQTTVSITGGVVSIDADGFNVATASLASSTILEVTYAQAFSSAGYQAIFSNLTDRSTKSWALYIPATNKTDSAISFQLLDSAGTAQDLSTGGPWILSLICTGRQ